MVLLDQVVFHYLPKEEMSIFSLQVNELSLENLMDVIYPCESASILFFFFCMLTNKLTFHLKSTRSAG